MYMEISCFYTDYQILLIFITIKKGPGYCYKENCGLFMH